MIIDWTDFEPLGTEKLNSAPGVCVTAAGSISVYASVGGPELELWYGSLLDGHVWSGLRLLDSEPIVSAPGVVARTPGSRDLFVRRPGYQLGHKAYDINIGWSPYEPVGPELFTNTTPAVCSRSTDRIDVFVRSATDHSLFILAFDGKRWLVATQLETDQLPARPRRRRAGAVGWTSSSKAPTTRCGTSRSRRTPGRPPRGSTRESPAADQASAPRARRRSMCSSGDPTTPSGRRRSTASGQGTSPSEPRLSLRLPQQCGRTASPCLRRRAGTRAAAQGRHAGPGDVHAG